MRRRELIETLRNTAEQVYDNREALTVAYIIGEQLFGTTRRDLIDYPEAEVVCEGLEQVLEDVASACPVQYITGKAEWDGVVLSVREGVLVPRPETEELMHWIRATVPADSQLNILDVGTGSGAIAISLAKHFIRSSVTAFDISPIALQIAAENGRGLGIEFQQVDILTLTDDRQWGLVVSNPPYIPRTERGQLHRNVVEYEPDEALFVDSDPLLFYREIVRRVKIHSDGWLFFECHETYTGQVTQLLIAEGFTGVELKCDINDKPRMVCGRHP